MQAERGALSQQAGDEGEEYGMFSGRKFPGDVLQGRPGAGEGEMQRRGLREARERPGLTLRKKHRAPGRGGETCEKAGGGKRAERAGPKWAAEKSAGGSGAAIRPFADQSTGRAEKEAELFF